MIASNMSQLVNMLRGEMTAAMQEANSKIHNVMKTEVGSFYSQGKPEIYVRTGALGNSPKVTSVSGGGSTVSFDAYLDQSYSYSMPNMEFIKRGYSSYFSTPEVLEVAENHSAHILGKSGFWARSESQFQSILDNAMRSHFN